MSRRHPARRRDRSQASPAAGACSACGAPLHGPFCAACGERQPRPSDESLVWHLTEGIHEVFGADGRTWRTVRDFMRPGVLTEAYLTGKRTWHLRPVRVFLLVNLVFFLLMRQASGSAFLGGLGSHVEAPFYGRLARVWTEAQRGTWGLAPDAYADAFNAHAAGWAPTLIGVLVPLLALVLAALVRRGSAVRHLVLATHVVAWLMALTVGLGGALMTVSLVLPFGSGSVFTDAVLVPLLLAGLAAYLVLATRRVYGTGWGGSIVVAGLGSTVGLYLAVTGYRFVLFLVTFSTLVRPA